MTPAANLYLEYLYSRSKTARQEFLDALATEETDAMVVNLRDFSMADGGGVPASVPLDDGRVK